MTIIAERVELLDLLTLDAGFHAIPEDGTCLLEAVSYIAGERWSAYPKCASPVLASFLRGWNDKLDNERRQDLKQYAVPLVGSAGEPAQENQRSWMIIDWLVRMYIPAWLRLAGFIDQATKLTNLPELQAVPLMVRNETDAAWDGAFSVTGHVILTPTLDGAAIAAWDAMAETTVWNEALNATWEGLRWQAWDAIWDIKGSLLAPTHPVLIASAYNLVERMLAVTEDTQLQGVG